jgi:hypothetical protein
VFSLRDNSEALPVLLAVAENADGRLAANIYRAVGSLGGVELVPGLLERRAAADATTRRSIERAVIAIGRRFDDGQVVAMLVASWPAGDEAEDSAVIRMVGAIGDPAGLAFLTPLVEEASPRPVALSTVCRWTSADVLPLLHGIVLREDLSEADRRSAWQGILRLTPEFGWQHREAQVRWAGVLMDTALNNDDRLRALEAFGQIDRRELIAFPDQWLEDPDVGTAARAAQDSVRNLTDN